MQRHQPNGGLDGTPWCLAPDQWHGVGRTNTSSSGSRSRSDQPPQGGERQVGQREDVAVDLLRRVIVVRADHDGDPAGIEHLDRIGDMGDHRAPTDRVQRFGGPGPHPGAGSRRDDDHRWSDRHEIVSHRGDPAATKRGNETWLARQGSNLRHPAPKADVLPIELRATVEWRRSQPTAPSRRVRSQIGRPHRRFRRLPPDRGLKSGPSRCNR